jgi:hypothetical protein
MSPHRLLKDEESKAMSVNWSGHLSGATWLSQPNAVQFDQGSLDSLVVSSCLELFALQGMKLTRRAPTPMAESIDGYSGGGVSFASSALSGEILLVGSFDFLAASLPLKARRRVLSEASPDDWRVVRDWSKTLVQQLFVRIRSTLESHDVLLRAQEAIALSGPALRLALRLRTTNPYELVTPDDKAVRAWVDAAPDVSLSSRIRSSSGARRRPARET